MPFKLLSLGDVMLGENLNHLERGIRTKFVNNFENLILSDIYDKITKDIDFVFYNFEYSVSTKSLKKTTKYEDDIYLSVPESLRLFNNKVKRIVNIANNHFSQHGKAVVQYTKALLNQNDFIIIGENNKPVIISNNKENVFFWGVSLIGDKYFCNEYFLSTYNKLFEEIELPISKKGKDIWIISIHWGDEYIGIPNQKQISLAHKLIDNGFDLIIGHHPHVIQPIEKYKSKYIFYSLGNFIFDQDFSKRTQTGLAIKFFIDNNNINSKIYQISTDNYKVKYLLKKKTNDYMMKSTRLYFIKHKYNNVLYRFLMKIEIIYNWGFLSSRTKLYYKEKLFNFLKLKYLKRK